MKELCSVALKAGVEVEELQKALVDKLFEKAPVSLGLRRRNGFNCPTCFGAARSLVKTVVPGCSAGKNWG